MVMGDGRRLARRSTISSTTRSPSRPEGGLVVIAATRLGDEVHVRIETRAPASCPPQREAIFRRFHSERPEAEAFGRHSGLGLAIARTIVEGHDGQIDGRGPRRRAQRRPLRRPPAGWPAARAMSPLSSETVHASLRRDRRPRGADRRAAPDGKSDLALRLIDRGARLVSDDCCDIWFEQGRLWSPARRRNSPARSRCAASASSNMPCRCAGPAGPRGAADRPDERMPDAERGRTDREHRSARGRCCQRSKRRRRSRSSSRSTGWLPGR